MQRVIYRIESLRLRTNRVKLLKKLNSIVGINAVEYDELTNRISFIYSSFWGLKLAEYYLKKASNDQLEVCNTWNKLRPCNQVYRLPKGSMCTLN